MKLPCVSMKSNTNIRCKKTVDYNKTVLCYYHKNSQRICNDTTDKFLNTRKILIEYLKQKIEKKYINFTKTLDSNFDHTLLGLYSSWQEVEYYRRICITNKWWDINILADHISHQLNNSSMNNPKPVFPSDPFTKIDFTFNELKNIINMFVFNKTKVNIATKYFFLNLDEIYKKYIPENMSYVLSDILGTTCRFKLINNKNSQNCYNGVWVNKDSETTNFETLLNNYLTIPRQIQTLDIYGYERIVTNGQLRILNRCLDTFKLDEYCLTKNCEII